MCVECLTLGAIVLRFLLKYAHKVGIKWPF